MENKGYEIKQIKQIKQKLSNQFCCIECGYYTDRKNNLTTHFTSSRHKKSILSSKPKKEQNNLFECDICGKLYQTNSGLWKHNKMCFESVQNNNIIEQPLLITSSLIMELIKDNKDMKQIIIDQNYIMNNTMNHLLQTGTNNTNINNTNSLNKTFNLQFFLNETCKDAMNMTDFVNSIKFQLNDLEKMGDIGYVQGISNIITKNLQTLEVNQRPVHCTDQKRETIYIKDENKWEKEDDNKTKLRKIIQRITNKNMKILPQFREKHPDYGNSALKISDVYDKLVLEVMGGAGNNDTEKENKIIHNISKCVMINK